MEQLPMDTILDGPARHPDFDDEFYAMLKAMYLQQPIAQYLRTKEEMSDTEIVDTLEQMRQAGILQIAKSRRHGIALKITEEGLSAYAAAGGELPPLQLTAAQAKAKAKNRHRRKLSRPRRR